MEKTLERFAVVSDAAANTIPGTWASQYLNNTASKLKRKIVTNNKLEFGDHDTSFNKSFS